MCINQYIFIHFSQLQAKARFEFDLQMKREEEERKKMIERMVQANRSKYTMGKKAKNAGGVDYYADI